MAEPHGDGAGVGARREPGVGRQPGAEGVVPVLVDGHRLGQEALALDDHEDEGLLGRHAAQPGGERVLDVGAEPRVALPLVGRAGERRHREGHGDGRLRGASTAAAGGEQGERQERGERERTTSHVGTLRGNRQESRRLAGASSSSERSTKACGGGTRRRGGPRPARPRSGQPGHRDAEPVGGGRVGGQPDRGRADDEVAIGAEGRAVAGALHLPGGGGRRPTVQPWCGQRAVTAAWPPPVSAMTSRSGPVPPGRPVAAPPGAARAGKRREGERQGAGHHRREGRRAHRDGAARTVERGVEGLERRPWRAASAPARPGRSATGGRGRPPPAPGSRAGSRGGCRWPRARPRPALGRRTTRMGSRPGEWTVMAPPGRSSAGKSASGRR